MLVKLNADRKQTANQTANQSGYVNLEDTIIKVPMHKNKQQNQISTIYNVTDPQ